MIATAHYFTLRGLYRLYERCDLFNKFLLIFLMTSRLQRPGEPLQCTHCRIDESVLDPQSKGTPGIWRNRVRWACRQRKGCRWKKGCAGAPSVSAACFSSCSCSILSSRFHLAA